MKLTISIILLFLTSCNLSMQPTFNLAGTWKLQDIITTNDFEQAARQKASLKESAQIHFFKDKTYSFVAASGAYIKGTWTFDASSKRIKLDPDKNSNGIIRSIEIEENGNRLILTNPEGIAHAFAPGAASMEKETDDPFHPDNNKWRERAKEKESEEQIRMRVKNYIKHFALILKAAKDRNAQVVNFEYSQGPIQVYSSAIGVYPYETVPAAWKQCFYNNEDAFAGYTMYENALNSSSFQGASSGSWIVDDYNILLTIYGMMYQDE